ncbi:MAG: transposase [Boseongicola sp.]|nr:transposase [Boseongicola sp.]
METGICCPNWSIGYLRTECILLQCYSFEGPRRVKPLQVCSGSPLDIGYNKRFKGTLRREVLNTEWFHTIKHAQIAQNVWLRQYNIFQPHHGLNMRPPVPESLLAKHQSTGTETSG